MPPAEPPRNAHHSVKVLLTGAGTLIARGVHEALRDRDANVEFVGANLDIHDPTAMLCSRVHPLPPDDQPAALAEAIATIAAAEKPDIVVPCRDPHIEVLAELQDTGRLTGRAPVGPVNLAKVMVDKWDAYQWCLGHGLPFAPSTLTGENCSMAGIETLIADYGLPLIAKPRDGSGSLGVRVVTDRAQAERVSQLVGIVVQPFLDPPAGAKLTIDASTGTPLFWEIPTPQNFGGQYLIGPDGELGPGMQVFASQRLGRNETTGRWFDETLEALMQASVAAFAADGWVGPVTIQARPHEGEWYITEFGGRFSGGTSQRAWLGLDEVGWVINTWAGREAVPPLASAPAHMVRRYLTDIPVWDTPRGPALAPPEVT